ncbi:MAG: S-layer homology domain-containing protein [Bacillota bacterium]|nr:S-layer homology domain-containing protein [Bacillota bacterium]
MKKIIIISIISTLFISGISFGFSFTDVSTNDWFYEDVTELTNEGIINGFMDGTFRPDEPVNIDQFIKLIVTSLGHDFENGEIYWARPFIDKAIELNLIETDTFANYRSPISRGEMAKIIVNALNENYTNEIFEYSFYMKDYFLNKDEDVLKAYYLGIITGYPDGSFYPEKLATRAEASTMLMRMLREERRIDTDYLLEEEAYLKMLNKYYMNLKTYYLDIFSDISNYESYDFDNGDVIYNDVSGNDDIYIWNDGDIFIGEMNDGEYGEQGYFIWEDTEYIGQLNNGLRNGEGVMVFSDAVYTGDFSNGNMTGVGMVKWNDEHEFVGNYIDGIVDGLGKEYYPNGDYYIGNFDKGFKDGMGICTNSNGLTYYGTFNQEERDADDFTMYYNYSEGREFEEEIESILNSTISAGMSKNEKIKSIYDYLILNVSYDYEGYDSDDISNESHSAYGALVNGVAVCDGYSDAVNVLLNRLGIESDIVIGEADEEGHAWNHVEFEEGYYYIDVTWDDGDNGELRYDYFKKTLSKMNRDHVVEIIVE